MKSFKGEYPLAIGIEEHLEIIDHQRQLTHHCQMNRHVQVFGELIGFFMGKLFRLKAKKKKHQVNNENKPVYFSVCNRGEFSFQRFDAEF